MPPAGAWNQALAEPLTPQAEQSCPPILREDRQGSEGEVGAGDSMMPRGLQ